jgi:(p)ppGpp synthase/HD superfamily hydrolase
MKIKEFDLLEKALEIAVKAHRGQKDRYGAPYILHPLRVMNRVETLREKMVAILHDVVEDTKWTFADLQREGFPKEVIAAVDCLTKRDKEPYDSLISRAASNPVARKVKLADLQDNMDASRLNNFTAEDAKRFTKYISAWQRLASVEGPGGKIPRSEKV